MYYISTWRTLKSIFNEYENRYSIKYSSSVFLFILLISYIDPKLFPIVITSILVYLLRLLTFGCSRFSREDYAEPLPIFHNIGVNHFSILLFAFVLILLLSILNGVVLLWGDLGKLSFAMGAVSIFVITWSMSLYEKNFFYNHWHLDMRFLIVVLGILSLLTPVFLPLFILIYHVINQQFNCLSIGTLGYHHTGPPLTTLLIISGFAISNLLFPIQSYMVQFLLLCGYSAHYFYSGLKKLQIGGARYYLLKNNPFFMAMHAYNNGWLHSFPKRTVAKLGWCTEKWKPILNLFPIIIEIGSLFILVSYSFTLLISILHLVLHLAILLITGDNFWKWMSINISIIIGIMLFSVGDIILFDEKKWFIYSLIFIILANAWMFPKALYWLDTPYSEYLKFEAEFSDNSDVKEINPVILSPWDEIISQGFTGVFTYLGSDPRITFSWGNTDSAATHKAIMNIYPQKPDEDILRHLAENFGDNKYSKKATREFEHFLELFDENRGFDETRRLKYVSAPKQYYHHGLPFIPNYNVPDKSPRCLKLYRIDGIWTLNNFHVIRKREVLSVTLND